MMHPDARLAYMANQIARNFAAQGAETAALAVADHIAAFWNPRMKARLFEMAGGVADPPLEAIAARAIYILRTRGAPPHQSAATRFADANAVGASDAG